MKNKIFIIVLAVLFCSAFGYYVLAAKKQDITLTRNKTVLVKGEKVKLSGTVTPKRKNVEVKIYSKKRKTGQFSLFKTVITNNKGNYKYSFRPDKTAYYQLKAEVSSKTLISKTKKIKVGIVPVLRNLEFNFDRYNPDTSRAGAFLFGSFDSQIFLEFGDTVVNDQGPKMLATFEYRVDPNAKLYAVSYGTVYRVHYKATEGDYEILTYTSDNSEDELSWNVNYDHLQNPNVKVGDVVNAGDVLGNAGAWTDGLARTELIVTDGYVNGSYAYCPFDYFEPKLKVMYEQKMTNLMLDWESYKNDPAIYNQSAMVAPGCLYHKMVDDGGGAHPAN